MPRDDNLKTISVNLPATLVERIRNLGFHQHLSASSIIEASLDAFLIESTDSELGSRLRASGATLRRS
jgi:hypothetical protein